MILSKMTLLGAALGVAAVIGSVALAWVHKGAATADHGNAHQLCRRTGEPFKQARPQTRAYVPSGSGRVFRINP